ncbi:MAG: type III pantothenate kinase [Candidatus Zixiibacteriota bacterium]
MLLAIDIGNSNTVVGAFDDGNLINHFRLTSNHNITIDECGFLVMGLLEKLNLQPKQVARVIIASVVPRLTPIFREMSKKYLSVEPIIVSCNLKLPIKIAYDDPSAVGADRIANAVAGFVKFGGPIIIVDYGTTTNFDVINDLGVYLGGAIAPGPETSARELANRAARLFEVTVEKPRSAVGRNTADSIKSGLFHGTVGQVDYIISLIRDEMGGDVRVVATGGLAEQFVQYSRFIESSYPALTLEGLKIIADYQTRD